MTTSELELADILFETLDFIDDELVNGTLIKGIRNKNLLQIIAANTKMPGLTDLLTNPLQFYQDTSFTAPKDINE